MCYIEASYYIHCTHLNVHFWTCSDLEHGHLRPKSVMHSYHRLCPACFKKKYVRKDGEGEDLEDVDEEADGEAATEPDSEDGVEELPVATRLARSTPSRAGVGAGRSQARNTTPITWPVRQPVPAPTSLRPGFATNISSADRDTRPLARSLGSIRTEQGRPPAWGRSGEGQGSFANQARLQAELAATRRYVDERRERPERNTADLSRSGTWLQQAVMRSDEPWDPLKPDLLETTEQRARNLAELAKTPRLTDEELSLIAGPSGSSTDGLLEAIVRIGREAEPIVTTVADLIGARDRVVQEHAPHTVQAEIQQHIEVAERRILRARDRAYRLREQLLQTRQRRARLADQRMELEATERRMNYLGDLAMSRNLSLEEQPFLLGGWDSSTDELLEAAVIVVNLAQRLRRGMSVAGRVSQVDGELPRARQRALQARQQLLEARGRRLRQGRERGRARIVVISRGGQVGEVLRIEARRAMLGRAQQDVSQDQGPRRDRGQEREEPTDGPNNDSRSPRSHDSVDATTTSNGTHLRAITPRPASRSSRRLLHWTAFETQERPKRPKICHERDCKNKFEHHDDAKSLLQATELKDGADNNTAIHLIRFIGCGHLNVVMLEKPAETSPWRWSTKCGCKFPPSNGTAREFLADEMVESREKCLFCHRSNLRRGYFSRSARLIEARDIPRWQDEVSGPD